MDMPVISMIAIVARDGAIGRGGDQPFHISADFKRFKQLTLGHPVIMGRRTFEALPGGALPGRRNIVISRNPDYRAEGAETSSSIGDAIAMCDGAGEVFIIGGGRVYSQAISMADRLLMTEVSAEVPDADTFFPAIDPEVWTVAETSPEAVDPRSGVSYRFVTYLRRS